METSGAAFAALGVGLLVCTAAATIFSALVYPRTGGFDLALTPPQATETLTEPLAPWSVVQALPEISPRLAPDLVALPALPELAAAPEPLPNFGGDGIAVAAAPDAVVDDAPAVAPQPDPALAALADQRPLPRVVPEPAPNVLAALRPEARPAPIEAPEPEAPVVAEAEPAPAEPAPAPAVTGPSPAIMALAATLDPMARPNRLIVPQTTVAAAAPAPAPAPAQARTEDTTVAAAQPPAADPAPAPQVEVARVAPATSLAPRAGSDPCSTRLANAIPRRPGSAPGANAFLAALGESSGPARDQAIIQQLASGNMPGFVRDLSPVALRGTTADGSVTEVIVCVTPDYLALGSNTDFVRVPMGLQAALAIASRFNMMLPTTRMVDAIHAQAQLRLSPQPMDPGSQMSSTSYFMRHNATVQAQLGSAGGTSALLTAGHKKDIVLTNRLASNPGRVAIYGWHWPGGTPIQPLSTVHGASYADYSHGVRLVSETAFVNGRAVPLGDLLADARYGPLLNNEGPVRPAVIQLASR